MKTGKVRHRRLSAFYESKVLNALMLTMETSLLLGAYTQSMLLPIICGSIALLCFIGYSIWFWVRKPQKVVINKWLSAINVWFTLYFLIIMAMDAPNQWWYITPICFAVCILCISLIRNHDERFDITA